jgi:hypothetical protein
MWLKDVANRCTSIGYPKLCGEESHSVSDMDPPRESGSDGSRSEISGFASAACIICASRRCRCLDV